MPMERCRAARIEAAIVEVGRIGVSRYSEWDPDFENVKYLKNIVTNLSTESFMCLISDNLSFRDDNFQTIMVERNGYDRFYPQFSFRKTQKISTLHLERLNKDFVNKNIISIERTEGTGIYMEMLDFTNNDPYIDHTYSQAKSHVM